MMVADSSVWIDYFNGVQNPKTDLFDDKLYEGKVHVLDIILVEVLQGFKSDKDFGIAKELLSNLPMHHVLGKVRSINAANNFRMLRKKGITIRKTIDVIIASWCIEEQAPLLACDKDFENIAAVLPLKLLKPPLL